MRSRATRSGDIALTPGCTDFTSRHAAETDSTNENLGSGKEERADTERERETARAKEFGDRRG